MRARDDGVFDAAEDAPEDARDPLVGLVLLAIPPRYAADATFARKRAALRALRLDTPPMVISAMR